MSKKYRDRTDDQKRRHCENTKRWQKNHPEWRRESAQKRWAKVSLRCMIDADYYAELRRAARERLEKWRRKRGMRKRGPMPSRTIADWCTKGRCVDARSAWLEINADASVRAYAMRLAIERGAAR